MALVLGLIAAAPRAAAGELPPEIADAAAPRPTGLVVRVGSTDGKAEVALARGGTAVVHGLALDDAARDVARRNVAAEGLYGAAVSVERPLAVDPLPYADDLVNLLVADLDALGDKAPPAAEVTRVLAPRGVAWLKRGGAWEKAVKPPPEGTDDWTHFFHDAGGNPVSGDRRVGPPTGLQWIAGVAAAGADPVSGYRLGEGRAVYEWKPPEGRRGDPAGWIVCRDAHSGVLLWAEPTGVEPYKTRPIVLADGRVFTYVEPEGPMVALDAATGEVLTTFDQGGRAGKRLEHGRMGVNLSWHDGLLIETAGNTVYVLDGRSGELKWKASGPDGTFMDYPTVLAGTGQLFVTNGATGRDVGRYPGTDVREILAFDLKTGREQWRRPLGRELAQLSASDGRLFAFNLSGFIGRERRLFIARLDPADGSDEWRVEPDVRAQLLDMAVVGNRVYVMSLELMVFDADTGRQVAKYNMPGNSRCDMSRASANYLLMSFGNFVDLSTDPLQLSRSEISRSTCGGGSTPGYGMMYHTPNRCGCFESVRGYLAASREPVREPLADERRLEKGGATSARRDADKPWPAADEWPIFLGNPTRGSASATNLPAELKPLWKVTPAGVKDAVAGPAALDRALSSNFNGHITGATVAGGKAFVAAPEAHRVIALDAATGDEAWSFTAGGRVDSPPTIYQGLCLFGCRDGWVYALHADSGKLVWRFFAAPYERNMVAFNGVESSWPVFGSVMVQDGVLVAPAGRHPETNGGIVAYGLEPHTGKMLWKTPIGHTRKPGPLGGKIPDEGITTRPYGYNANTVINELLTSDGKWVAMKGLSLAPKTGEIGERVVAGKNPAGRGREPRVSPLSVAFSFGMRGPYRNQQLESYGGPGPGAGNWSLRVEGDDPRRPKVDVSGEMIAFSADRVVSNRIGSHELAVWDRKGGVPEIGRTNSEVTADAVVKRDEFRDGTTAKALLLAGDTIVFAVNRRGAEAGRPGKGEVYLYAARDGARLGKIELEGTVAQTGVSAAYGRLYVSLEDGTVRCFGQ